MLKGLCHHDHSKSTMTATLKILMWRSARTNWLRVKCFHVQAQADSDHDDTAPVKGDDVMISNYELWPSKTHLGTFSNLGLGAAPAPWAVWCSNHVSVHNTRRS